MGSLYVLTLYMQRVRDYSPIMTGLAWLPFAVGIILGAGLAPKLLLSRTPRIVAGGGALLSALAALWFHHHHDQRLLAAFGARDAGAGTGVRSGCDGVDPGGGVSRGQR